MKSFVKGILFTGMLTMASSSVMVGQTQTGNSWSEQWYQAKHGRPSPLVEARQNAAQANTAYREETSNPLAAPASSWYEGWYRAKFGRPSPSEEARLKADEATTAYREEASVSAAVPANSWFEGWYRAKFGRPSPTEADRLKAQSR
jgi:hypothetical protein